MHVAAAMFTPASLIAAATSASAPGVLSMSMTRSTAMCPCDVTLRGRAAVALVVAGEALAGAEGLRRSPSRPRRSGRSRQRPTYRLPRPSVPPTAAPGWRLGRGARASARGRRWRDRPEPVAADHDGVGVVGRVPAHLVVEVRRGDPRLVAR